MCPLGLKPCLADLGREFACPDQAFLESILPCPVLEELIGLVIQLLVVLHKISYHFLIRISRENVGFELLPSQLRGRLTFFPSSLHFRLTVTSFFFSVSSQAMPPPSVACSFLHCLLCPSSVASQLSPNVNSCIRIPQFKLYSCVYGDFYLMGILSCLLRSHHKVLKTAF